MASEFLMVWDMLNMKITTKLFKKKLRWGETTTKTPKTDFFQFFFYFAPILTGKLFIMVWGMLNTKITKKKFSKNLKGRKNDDEK